MILRINWLELKSITIISLLKKKITKIRAEVKWSFARLCSVLLYKEKGIAICCETFLLTVETSRKLLSVIDKLTSNMFLPDGLARLGWCTNYQMNSRIVYNKKEKDKFEKIQISEFYWFNYSASEKMCDCFHCHCFSLISILLELLSRF